MLKGILLSCLAAAILLLSFHSIAADDVFLKYLARNPESGAALKAVFFLGQVFYSVQSYGKARHYFLHISDYYPDSRYAEEAAFYALQSLRLSRARPIGEMPKHYHEFVERYPDGKYAPLARELALTSEEP